MLDLLIMWGLSGLLSGIVPEDENDEKRRLIYE